MKTVDEIYRDFPDEEREKRARAEAAARAPKQDPPRCCGGWSYVLLPCFILLGLGVLAVPRVCDPRPSREAAARHFVEVLHQAVVAYEVDHGAYPPGDGRGSRGLAEALAGMGPKKFAYFEFPEDMIDAGGNILSPLGGVVHYRSPGERRPKAFDLWTRDRRGRSDGINNWD